MAITKFCPTTKKKKTMFYSLMQCECKNSKQSYPMQIKSYKTQKQFRLEQNV